MISRGLKLMDIVQLVALRLKVTPIDRWRRQLIKKPHRQKIIDHLLLASLKSGELVDLSDIQLAILSHLPFLTALANILEAAITHGLDIAQARSRRPTVVVAIGGIAARRLQDHWLAKSRCQSARPGYPISGYGTSSKYRIHSPDESPVNNPQEQSQHARDGADCIWQQRYDLRRAPAKARHHAEALERM